MQSFVVSSVCLLTALALVGACSEPAGVVGSQVADAAQDVAASFDAAEPDTAPGDAPAALPTDAPGAEAALDTQLPEVAADVAPAADAVPEVAADTAADAKTTADAAPDVPAQPPLVVVVKPAAGAVFESGKPIDLVATVSDPVYPAAKLVVTWSSSLDGDLGSGPPDASGQSALTVSKLKAGQHLIAATVKNPAGVQAAASVTVGVCAWQSPETFDTKLDGVKWQKYGDAYWDAGGWLEMTGNAQSKLGQIFNVTDYIQPGDVQIAFKIQTGAGLNGGADGFAMSVIDAKTKAQLESIIQGGNNGGCLGYGVSGVCGSLKVDAFHVEFDTYENKGDVNVDPTPANHIGVMQNGDASKHWLWAAVPLEDMTWHAITVEIKKDVVRVTVDGVEKINGAIPDFKFRGGYIGFSGSTGWASNWHRFDDLEILQQCLVK